MPVRVPRAPSLAPAPTRSRSIRPSARAPLSSAAHRRQAPVLAWTANDPATVRAPRRRRRGRDRLRRPWNGAGNPGYTACAVKRLHAAVLFVLGFAAAGAFSGAVIADVTTSTTSSTVATTTAPATTTSAATTTTTTTTITTTPASGKTLPPGVRVAGVRVGGAAPCRGRFSRAGGLPPPAARRGRPQQARCSTPRRSHRPTAPPPSRGRASRSPGRACSSSSPCTARRFMRGSRPPRSGFARAPVDASLKLKNGKPFLTRDEPGAELDTARLDAGRSPRRCRRTRACPCACADEARRPQGVG